MESFTLGRKKIGEHYYDYYGTESSHRKLLETRTALMKKGRIVEAKDQMVGKKKTWVIYTRPDKRKKQKIEWKEEFKKQSEVQDKMKKQYDKITKPKKKVIKVPEKKKTTRKKHDVLKEGFFMKGDRRFNLHRKFSEESVAEKVLKNIQNEGYFAELSTYSSKKHKQPFIIFKGPKKKARRVSGRKTGSRNTNYKNQQVKEKSKLKKLARDYINLSVLPEKEYASKMRKLSGYYKNKKNLTPTQKKRAARIKEILKETLDLKKKSFELKVKMKKSRAKIKEIEKKMVIDKKKSELKPITKLPKIKRKPYTDEELRLYDESVAEFGPRPPRKKKVKRPI